jgi:DcuC family C4-dicarboxylate transporter
MMTLTLILGLLIIAAGIYAVFRGIDVRLALLLTALTLGVLGGDPALIVRTFLETFSNERYVVPICTAMGFAYVLRHTGCDKHLVVLLVRPLTHVRLLLIPGTVMVGFLVNIPIISQTSSAVTLGAVIIPVLLAARLSLVTTGAALLLGCSIGGELLNPGAPELRTVVEESEKAAKTLKQSSPNLDGATCVARLLPFDLLGLSVATLVFWGLCLRAEARRGRNEAGATVPPSEPGERFEPVVGFRVNLLMAFLPVLPLVLLFLIAPPLRLIDVPEHWLVRPAKKVDRPQNVASDLAVTTQETPARLSPEDRGLFDSRLIGAAMLVGVAAVSVVVWRKALTVPRAFFEGAGYGFTHIISLIVTANCFGKGIEQIGLAQLLGTIIEEVPWILIPAAGSLSLLFGALCGSGMATTQSLFPFFAVPTLRLGIDPAVVGAVVSLAAAAGRTMSPVAAVTLMTASMTQTNPLELVRRVMIPLLAGMTAVVIAAMLFG